MVLFKPPILANAPLLFILYHILSCWSIARLGMAFPSTAIGQLLVTHAGAAAMKNIGRRRTSFAHCNAVGLLRLSCSEELLL